jgi:glycyl-tRNA synthetase beta chain
VSAPLFIELRCEELPARFVTRAEEGLRDAVLGLLKGISHGAVRTFASPRRVAVAVSGVAPARPTEEVLVTGPAAAAAFKDGAPTKVAEGFARGKGLPVEALEVVDGPKGPVIAARVRSGGEATPALLAQGLEAAVLAIDFPKTMTWGPARWARPIQGVVALYDGQPIALSIAGVAAAPSTSGHRLRPGALPVATVEGWEAALRQACVIADREARRAEILAQLHAAAAAEGARVGELGLVDEVVDLVEWPQVVVARFAEELLDLPPRLLIESMGVHQRVFPLFVGDRLSNRFLVVSNHPNAQDPACAATIATGNARVLAARFHDAKFFYAEDRKRPLQAHGQKLSGMQWIRGAGTMAEKTARVGQIAEALAPTVGADPADAARAGALAKADLATQMVGEFPELQGHVGRLLAAIDGEPGGVPLAIEEHYLPRFAGDALPASPAGLAVALADRLDTLAHTFRLGLKPKGSADPLGLRRAAGGLVALILGAGLRAPLSALLPAGGALPAPVADELRAFVLARARATLQERYPTDLVEAVLSAGDDDLVAADARCAALHRALQGEAGAALRTTFKRVLNIVKDHSAEAVDAAALDAPAEQALLAALDDAAPAVRAALDALDVDGAIARLVALRPAVDRLFDEVMVMADDPAVRANRLGLLARTAAALRGLADFKALS